MVNRPLQRALSETPGFGDFFKKMGLLPDSSAKAKSPDKPVLKTVAPGVVKKAAGGKSPTPGAPETPAATLAPAQAPTVVVKTTPAFDPQRALKDFDPTRGKSPHAFLQMKAAKWAAAHPGAPGAPEKKGFTKADYLKKKASAGTEKWISSGGVVLQSKDDMSKVLVIKPSGNYGPWAFPKGRVNDGETMQLAAQREVWEETGVKAKFLDVGKHTYLGSGMGTMSVTHFFLMYRAGGHPHPTEESEKAVFVTWQQAINLFLKDGNKRDVKIALKAMGALGITA